MWPFARWRSLGVGGVLAIGMGCATHAETRTQPSSDRVERSGLPEIAVPPERALVQLCPGSDQLHRGDRTFPRVLGSGRQPLECEAQPYPRIEGQVLIEATVDAQGRPTSTRIVQSAPSIDVICMRRAMVFYLPAIAHGAPVEGIALLVCGPASSTK